MDSQDQSTVKMLSLKQDKQKKKLKKKKKQVLLLGYQHRTIRSL